MYKIRSFRINTIIMSDLIFEDLVLSNKRSYIFSFWSYIVRKWSFEVRIEYFQPGLYILVRIVYFRNIVNFSRSYTFHDRLPPFHFKEGDGLRLNTQSTVRSTNCVFPIGKEIDYKTMDGRNVKSTLEFDNNVAKVRDPRTSRSIQLKPKI